MFAEIDLALLGFASSVQQNPSCGHVRVEVRYYFVAAKSKDAAGESMDWS